MSEKRYIVKVPSQDSLEQVKGILGVAFDKCRVREKDEAAFTVSRPLSEENVTALKDAGYVVRESHQFIPD